MNDRTSNFIIIEHKSGWQPINWKELWRYRDLFLFLIWRDVKTKYAQTILGIGWAIIQPVFSMIIFTIVFGNLARISSDGVPYAVFSFAALVPWTYFSGSLSASSGSLINASSMLTKVYFPRLIIPISPVLSQLVDFLICFNLLLVLMAFFGFYPTIEIIYIPLLIFKMALTASGMGMWITALSIQYRDIKHAMGFFIQLLMYAAPVVYSVNNIPDKYRLVYGLFPMVGVIEGFRSCLLKTNPMPWDIIFIGSIVSIITFCTGLLYFNRMEKNFSDVA